MPTPSYTWRLMRHAMDLDANGHDLSALPWYNLADFGAVSDNSTDDTPAVQAAVDAMAAAGGGLCLVPGMTVSDLITLPDVDYADEEAITIGFIGVSPPASVPSVIGATPLNVGPGFRTTDASGNLFTGSSATGLDNFTNLNFVLRDLLIRTPANPTGHALDMLKVANIDFDNVQVDAGSLDVAGISLQTTATSFGIRLPRVNNGAKVRMNDVNVVGFYNGIQVSEHANLDGVFVWGSRKPWVFEGSYHAAHLNRCGWYHCKQGVEFVAGPYTNESYFTWTHCNIERANSGTWTQGDDIVDASDYGAGRLEWHAVRATIGVVHSFVNGGANVYALEIGEDPFGGGGAVAAEDVSVADAGGYFTGTDVEAALQEIGADVASSAGGHYEVVVSGSGPPVAVSTPSDDDWVHAFVAD